MLNLTLKEIAKLSNGELNNNKFEDLVVNVISIDTRTIEPNDMYMPIVGDKFDGHVFIEQAKEKSAIATFATKNHVNIDDDFPVIWVKNTNEAFRILASNYRKSLSLKIISLTGTNGKTTTKDLMNNILQTQYDVRKTIGNLNNAIGLPRTILRFEKNTEIGILEMGTEGIGEIEVLSNIAKPDIAIITNIGDSHLENLLTRENVAKEKLHILDGLSEDGIFIYNNDDEYLKNEMKNLDIKQKTISFGQSLDSDYVIEILDKNNNGSNFKLNDENYNISLIGNHQVYNASVAIIVAKLFGISKENIKKGLLKEDRTNMRSELMNLDGYDILNDSYKSNPQSLRSAIETLTILSGYERKIAILGDMLDLGENEIEHHRQVGREITPNEVDYLLLYGPLSKYTAEEAKKNFPSKTVFYCQDKKELIDRAKFLIKKNTLVLVKASRSLRLEEIIESISELHF